MSEEREKDESKTGDNSAAISGLTFPLSWDKSLDSLYLKNLMPLNVDYTPFTFASPYVLNLSDSTNKKIDELNSEIKDKEKENKALLRKINELHSKNEDTSTQLESLRKNVDDIQKRQELLSLTSKIHPQAANIIFDKNNLLDQFNSENETSNTIMSIDIRRSTDLMLNAKSSDDFATFITGLCEGLKKIVINNFGVFDKFTGDGILAYFPEFYSGDDAVYHCCIAAKSCHEFFENYYNQNRDKFKIIMKTGLGIGIDFGNAKLVRVNGEPTIVGIPVVYACRLSCAPWNHTYLNQPARERMKDNCIKMSEVDIEIKNQGQATVFDLIDLGDINIKKPSWWVANPNTT